jgi:hypothetical protein
MQLALDKATGDLMKPTGGGITRVSKGRFVVQQVQSKLSVLLGEWPLDRSIGWVNMADFVRNYNIYSIERRARQIILSTKGVLVIDTLSIDVAARVLTLTFTARTIHGNIELSVPWNAVPTEA